jgi:hypothetical protein
MDYSKLLKSLLEDNDLRGVLDELHVDRDTLLNCQSQNNICCSNGSYLFVYLEQSASFLALSLDRFCKSEDREFIRSFQVLVQVFGIWIHYFTPFWNLKRLSINAAPIGSFKNALINSNGTFILLVYDKSLTVVQLPSKYGKYGQYENGKSNIICKWVICLKSIELCATKTKTAFFLNRSIKFNLKNRTTIIDAVWHPRLDEDCVACLTNDHALRLFQVSKPAAPQKEFIFSSINFESLSTNDLVNSANGSFLTVEYWKLEESLKTV